VWLVHAAEGATDNGDAQKREREKWLVHAAKGATSDGKVHERERERERWLLHAARGTTVDGKTQENAVTIIVTSFITLAQCNLLSKQNLIQHLKCSRRQNAISGSSHIIN
jgi:hypothetical protein